MLVAEFESPKAKGRHVFHNRAPVSGLLRPPFREGEDRRLQGIAAMKVFVCQAAFTPFRGKV
jgi:hypothetical protein